MLEINFSVLTGLLCLFMVSYLSGLAYYISSLSFVTPISLTSKFCSLSEFELNSLIWSHRGHSLSPQQTSESLLSHDFDASVESISYLLSQGISNYDIDVSLQTSPPFNDTFPNFIVAHPSALANSPNLPFQTIKSFLNQISHHFPHPLSNLSTKYLYPFVTVEPKFENLDSLSQLLKEVMGTSLGFSGHVAIIVKDEIHLKEVEKWFYKHHTSQSERRLQPIAIAYRSQNPMGEKNYRWTRTSQGLPPQYFSRDSSSDSLVSFQHIHMPDFQLLRSKEEIEFSRKIKQGPFLPFQSDRYHRMESGFSDHRIVCWIVDHEEIMWEVFQDTSADMIITNRPVQMLASLRERHRNLCQG
jgi:hypothetical protein